MNLQSKKLYRSRTNRMLGGICGGLGDYLDLDPTVVRTLFVLLGFVTGGTALIFYIILLLVIPEEPAAPVPPSGTPPVPPVDPAI